MSAALHYHYRALQQTGAVERGTLSAESEDGARAALAARGLYTLEIRATDGVTDRRPRLPVDDLAAGLRALATLLGSGLPIGRALSALPDLTPPSWTPVIPGLRESVRQGQTLAAALEGAPVSIPDLLIGLIRAGESGSGLSQAVTRAAELAEEDAATRSALRQELAYPVLLLSSGGISVALIVGFVLPRFARILSDLGSELPPTTRLVLSAGELARAMGLPTLLAGLLALGALQLWTGTEHGRACWHAWLLGVPGLGGVRRSAATGRFAAALAGLLDAGVPIAAALRHAGGAAGDAAIAARLAESRREVMAGSSLSAALEANHASTPTLVRLVRAGEETGRLADMLAHGSRIEAESARLRLRSSIRLLQPALVLGFGLTVALVAAALLQAVYRVRPGG